ncbi:hypothetical protein RIR_jg21909.t1 [Rhizophagus irregularis DAOM 181602=DAOM 197198]|nr:hypothetical protein RIR_jg21909.t1 [Rhizophagus irregularis DAOM 181602=DAOM 197198]
MHDARVEELEQKNKELEGTRCCNWTATEWTAFHMLHHLLSIEDNLSRDMKIITCTDSEEAPSDEMSGLDRNQVTEQILNFEVWSL